jgi:UDP-N-acetylglucosamine acyltransferase
MAVVAPGATLGAGCEVHPFAVIGPNVRMGPGNVVYAHAVIEGDTEVGAGNVFHAHCHVGGPPQFAGWKQTSQKLRIGDENSVGEYASISAGAFGPEGGTVLGARNLLMAYVHIGHDCILGDDISMANAATLGGHVTVQNHAWLGGLAAVHQFARIGERAFVAGGAMVSQDVPPFCMVQGDRARLVSLNRVGLTRGGLQAGQMAGLRRAFRMLFLRNGGLGERIAAVSAELGSDPYVGTLIAFLQSSERGCITTVRRGAEN